MKKNLLFHLKALKAGTTKLCQSWRRSGNFLKVGAEAGAKTNSFSSATLQLDRKGAVMAARYCFLHRNNASVHIDATVFVDGWRRAPSM
jgi:hypothetical protein